MTQTVTGSGLGVLGQLSGMPGSSARGKAALGQGGASVYVNAINGNLVMQQTDGFLADAGSNLSLYQTYNSLGEGNKWLFNIQSRLEIHGVPGTEGSYVLRIAEDGHHQKFHWDLQQKQYRADEGGTASLRQSNKGWVFQNGRTKNSWEYNNQGQLKQIRDADHSIFQFAYVDGQLTQITGTSGKQQINWHFSDGQVTRLIMTSEDKTIQNIQYSYDHLGRLQRMNRALGDGSNYWINYEYTGDSQLINKITQADGSLLSIVYDEQGRVTRLIDGEGNVSSYCYEYGRTIFQSASGEQWIYHYDEQQHLIGVDGANNYRVRYQYQNNYLTQITKNNHIWQYRYNAQGDCIYISEPDGTIKERQFDTEHHLLQEWTYNLGLPSTVNTKTQWIYDPQGHLRFRIDAQAAVTEYRYNQEGLCISQRLYQGRTIQEDHLKELHQLEIWTQRQNQQKITLTDYQYDWRGQLCAELSYAQVDVYGVGILDEQTRQVHYLYDAAGNLQEKAVATTHGWSTNRYWYDSLGRLLQTVDAQGHIQNTLYDDAHQQSIHNAANGLQTIVTYDHNGHILAIHKQDLGHDFGIEHYQYDADGRLVLKVNASGLKNIYYYNTQGLLAAEISSTGKLTEYSYDQDGSLILSHTYNERAIFNSVDTPPNLSEVRPKTSIHDQIKQTIYNQNQQIAYTIDTLGGVVQ